METEVVLSILFFVFGIVALYFINLSSEPLHAKSINKSLEGKFVEVSGKITRLYNKRGNLLITLDTGESKITVFIFRSISPYIGELKKGQKIAVRGTVNVYKSYVEVVPKAPSDVKIYE